VSLPTDGRRSPGWQEAADAVVAAAGEWVLVAEGVPSNVAHRIRTGGLVAFRPAGRFEATTRRVAGTTSVDVWARLAD
jgi:hypothetical protein